MRKLLLLPLLLLCATMAHAQGACPAGLITGVTGNHCYFVAANGSDSNNCTAKATPCAHLPGMPNYSGSIYPTQYAAHAGDQWILKGGDTWHYGPGFSCSAGQSCAGGTLLWTWDGSVTSCDTSDNPSAVRTSCIYIGVDQTWYTGGSWTRPIFTDDNPTSTSPVASCTYGDVTRPGTSFSGNTVIVNNNAYAWFDNIEFTGMCESTLSAAGNGYLFDWYQYIIDAGGSTQVTQNIFTNNYFHGWTHLAFACSDVGGEPTGLCFATGALVLGGASTEGPGNVCDGWDSDTTGVGCNILGFGWLVYGNVFANESQGVVNGCHDIHDNYFFNFSDTGDGVAHGNDWECNANAPVNTGGGMQPAGVYNVFYRNVLGHNIGNTAGIKVQLAIASSAYPEYDFLNVVYDQGNGNNWDYGCSGCATPFVASYLFGNTFDLPSSIGTINCPANGTATGNHIIVEGAGTGFGAGSCTIGTNIVMNHATAVSQGFMQAGIGTSGNNSNTTCANDLTPCAETAITNSTYQAGGTPNPQSYCNTLLAANDTGDGDNIVRAGAICQSAIPGTIVYNTTTRTVTYPRSTPVIRPAILAWDATAYQLVGITSLPPAPAAPMFVRAESVSLFDYWRQP